MNTKGKTIGFSSGGFKGLPNHYTVIIGRIDPLVKPGLRPGPI